MVNEKVKLNAFQYLLSKIKSKGKEINYTSLFRCQGYLLPNNFLSLNPNGPELPETLKVQGEGQMARTYMFSYLASP